MNMQACAVSVPSPSQFELQGHQSQHTMRLRIDVKKERISTVLAFGSTFQGDLSLKEGVKVDGDLRGNLSFGEDDGLGIIARSATVQGNMRGPRALIMGTVEGDIFIHGLLVLSPTAMVIGNVHYDRLVVHDGAQISGTMNVNARPGEARDPRLMGGEGADGIGHLRLATQAAH